MSEERQVPVSILRQSEALADNLAAECDALRVELAAHKDALAEKVDEIVRQDAIINKLQQRHKQACADLWVMRREHSIALDSLHALAEWVDAVKSRFGNRGLNTHEQLCPGCGETIYDNAAEAYEDALFAVSRTLEGGWDALEVDEP